MKSKEEMFDLYKNDLKRLDAKRMRYLVIQYQCSFPKIDPDEMAVALINDGYHIEFDDSSISKAENEKHKNRVYRKAKGTKKS